MPTNLTTALWNNKLVLKSNSYSTQSHFFSHPVSLYDGEHWNRSECKRTRKKSKTSPEEPEWTTFIYPHIKMPSVLVNIWKHLYESFETWRRDCSFEAIGTKVWLRYDHFCGFVLHLCFDTLKICWYLLSFTRKTTEYFQVKSQINFFLSRNLWAIFD